MAETTTSPQPDPTVEARLQEIEARYGSRLSDEQRAQVRGRIAHVRALGVAMRQVPLTNADEPEMGFAPFRADLVGSR